MSRTDCNEILYLQYACHSWSKPLEELSEANAEGCFPQRAGLQGRLKGPPMGPLKGRQGRQGPPADPPE